jgi:hypothetical protein
LSVRPTASSIPFIRESGTALGLAESTPSIRAMADGFWVRPAPEVAALYARRAGFSWILKQLGACDDLVTRLIVGALSTIGVGVAFLLIDAIFGLYRDPHLSLLQAAPAAGVMFAVTLLVCPAATFICLSGWARSLIVASERYQAPFP